METTINVVYGVQAISAAPLFRVPGGVVVSSCRPVSGQECFGFGASASRVESVSGASVPRAAQVLSLHGYAGRVGLAGLAGLGQLVGLADLVEQRQAQQRQRGEREVLLAQVDGSDDRTSGISSNTGSDNDSTNGTKPMSPWGFRTSSPPG